MIRTQEQLLNLISDSIWRGIQASEVSEDVLAEAKLHAVDGLILPISYKKMVFFARYLHAEQKVISLLNNNSIPYVILKGLSASIYYPEQCRRSFGDIDFLVPKEYFYRAVKIMELDGFLLSKTQGDIQREYVYEKEGFIFEIHKCFSYLDLDIENYIIEGMKNRVTEHIDEYEFDMLPPLPNGLILLTHMRAHLKSGMGLRQIIDWMMYCDKILDDEFWNGFFKPVTDSLNLTTLAVTTTALCQKYLGLSNNISWCCSADDLLVDQLMEYLLSSGNFGIKKNTGNNVEAVTSAMKSQGIFYYLQRAGEHNWNLYQRHSWLRPFCWIYQAGRYFKQGLSRGKMIKSDLSYGNARFELLKHLEII